MKLLPLLSFLCCLCAATAQQTTIPIGRMNDDPVLLVFDSVATIVLIEIDSVRIDSGSDRVLYSQESLIDEAYILTSPIRCYEELRPADREKLQRILTNKPEEETIRAACFQPRNGILFYDRNHTLISYLEMCFQCQTVDYTGYLPYVKPGLTNQQLADIRMLFVSYGLKTSGRFL